MKIRWLGHSSFKLRINNLLLYIDPYAGEDYSDKADIILVSHGDYDHCNAEKIRQARTDDTLVITSADNAGHINAKALFPGNDIEHKGIRIRAVHAYKINRLHHEKEETGIGFLVSYDNKSLYHAGESDLIPEMTGLNPTVALIPVGGTYTMDARQAAVAAERINPEYAIPMHYGEGIVGNMDDAENFMELLENNKKIKVLILRKEEELDI